jgi:hypothetical protein
MLDMQILTIRVSGAAHCCHLTLVLIRRGLDKGG